MQRVLALLLWLCAGVCLAQQQSQQKEQPRLIAITGVSVVDVESGFNVPNQTVLIADGKIVLVSHPRNVGIPKHALRINGSGKYLIPGLWDMHTHVAGVSAKPEWGKHLLPVFLAQGVTGIRDMGGDLAALREWRRTAAQIPGPEMIVAGPFLDTSAEGYGSPQEVIAVKTPEEARAAVRKLRAEGANFIKIGSRLTRELYFAIADETGKLNMAFTGHVPEALPAEEASFSGMSSMEHLFGVMLQCSSQSAELRKRMAEAKDHGERVRVAEEIEATFSEEIARALFKEWAKRGTYQTPTLVWTRNTSTLDKANAADPGLRYVPEALRKEWTPANADRMVSPAGRAYYARKLKNDLRIIGLMNKAGVPILAGSDALDPFVFAGDSLHSELELLVSAGLSPVEALRAATVTAARFMAQERQRGEVRAGRLADLVMLDDDPLKDIRNTRKVHAVFARGVYYPRTELDKMLSDAARAFGAAPATPTPAP